MMPAITASPAVPISGGFFSSVSASATKAWNICVFAPGSSSSEVVCVRLSGVVSDMAATLAADRTVPGVTARGCTIWYMKFESSVRIAATPERVWDIFFAVEHWPEWTESISSVERLEPGPLKIGSRTKIKQPKFPVALWEVTELVDGEFFEWVATGPGVRTTAGHRVMADGDGAIAISTVVQAGPVGRLIGLVSKKLSNRYLAMEGAGLKVRAESGT